MAFKYYLNLMTVVSFLLELSLISSCCMSMIAKYISVRTIMPSSNSQACIHFPIRKAVHGLSRILKQVLCDSISLCASNIFGKKMHKTAIPNRYFRPPNT